MADREISWQKLVDEIGFDQFMDAAHTVIREAYKAGYTTEEIYMACHSMIGDAMYDVEVDDMLGDD